MKYYKQRKGKQMKNYIKIGNTKIELTEEQVAEIKSGVNVDSTKLSSVGVGETFKVGEYEFVVLEHSKETTAVILKGLLFNGKEFGKNNNYSNSNIDVLCNDFANKIKGIIGANNLVEHTVDLTSDDGLRDYGDIRRCASLLTANHYRRYVEILDKHKIDKWWWLATAHSTSAHENELWSKCVSPRGNFNCDYYDFDFGVRPFCIFNSNIFVSK